MSGWSLLRRLREAKIQTHTFSYVAAFQEFSQIRQRLVQRISELSVAGDYIVVGHSLGGVLLRAALTSLLPGTRRPKHIFLIGSPIQPSQLALRFRRNIVFRAFAGDCGQLLGSAKRMAEIGSLSEPTTSIVGVRGAPLLSRVFNGEQNDGVVSLSEVSADWIGSQIRVPVIHTFLPSNELVAKLIVDSIAAHR
jgi:hypothetical protein